MASLSHLSSPGVALSILLAVLALFTHPATSTSRSRNLAVVEDRETTGFRMKLKHVDADGNITKLERIQRAVIRGRQRMQRLQVRDSVDSLVVEDTFDEVKSAVYAGSGDYLMDLAIGTPPLSFSAILDTGSDLIWTQCQPCEQCFDQQTPVFDPANSSSFAMLSCASDLCAAVTSKCGKGGDCKYAYGYADMSYTQGVMATETFTFGQASVPKVAFGCGSDNSGGGFGLGAGLVGLGGGPISLVSQLAEPKFSYCLTSVNSNASSTLLMGSLASPKIPNSKTTPMIRSQSNPTFYYLSLQGISVGHKRLPIQGSTFALTPDGDGGVIIDSGTTLTYLGGDAFDVLSEEFTKQIGLQVDEQQQTGLDLCYSIPSNVTGESILKVPTVVFHFEGADLEIPPENLLLADDSGMDLCLAMGSSGGTSSIFGNVQQQNMLVVYDLAEQTVSFAPTQCEKL